MKHYITFILALTLFGSCQKSFDERSKAEAKDFTTKRCPQRVSEGIILDSMNYDNHKFTYFYSIEEKYDNPEIINKNAAKFRTGLLNEIISSVNLKKQKDEGVSFAYIYRSKKTKKELLNILITNKDYQHH